MPDAWELASIAVRFLTGLGLLGATGLVLVRMVFRSETSALHRYIVARAGILATIALVATALGFIVMAGALVDGVSGMIDAELLGMLWHAPVGTALGMRCAGLALLLAGLFFGALPLAAAGGLLAPWSVTGIGHVADFDTPWLRMLPVLHLAAAAFWIGILLPLRRMLDDSETHALAAGLGTRFGAIAQVTVPALVLAGAVMAWRLLGHPSALVTTGYGVILLARLAAVAGLLSAGAANRFRFVPALRTGDRTLALGLRRRLPPRWPWSVWFSWRPPCSPRLPARRTRPGHETGLEREGRIMITAARILAVLIAGWPVAAIADHELENRDTARGQVLYQEHCASCHGVELEGQANWRTPGADGILPAPPHDASGHTWHHDNRLLFDYTKLGGEALMRERGITGFGSGMTGFADVLDDGEIWDILAWIRSTWPDDIREIQSGRNPVHQQ